MTTELHLCEHPGCTRWALHNSATCGVHAGLVPGVPPSVLRTNGGTPGGYLPEFPLEGGTVGGLLDLVTAQRDSLHRYLRLRLGYRCHATAHDLRCLRALARTAVDLGAGQPDASATDEIDAFLDTIAQRVLDREAQVP